MKTHDEFRTLYNNAKTREEAEQVLREWKHNALFLTVDEVWSYHHVVESYWFWKLRDIEGEHTHFHIVPMPLLHDDKPQPKDTYEFVEIDISKKS